MICDDPPSRWPLFGRCPQDFATALEPTAATAASPARVRLARTHNTPELGVRHETEDTQAP